MKTKTGVTTITKGLPPGVRKVEIEYQDSKEARLARLRKNLADPNLPQGFKRGLRKLIEEERGK